MQAFSQAAEGIRTLDLLHGKQNVRSRASQESPGKERFPSYRWSARLPSFYREIAGVSGLKPDWGIMWIRPTPALTNGWEHIPPHAPGSQWVRVPLLLLDTSSSRRRRIGSLQTPACPVRERIRSGRRCLVCGPSSHDRLRVRAIAWR